MEDLISRQALCEYALNQKDKSITPNDIMRFPSAQPTLYGYSVDHLALIAHVMEKEGVSPEEAVRFFKDTQKICQMLVDEIQKQVEGMFESCVT